MRHVSAMTGEALHSKSAIAAELAHRDREIDRLQAENANLNAGYAAARLEIESLHARIKTMAEEHADELTVAHLDGRMRVAQPAPQQEAQEPCPTCAALARTVMLDQVSFDRKPDCYGIRQITDDEGVEEWEDIRTSPDVAREEANDMMATGRGEIYEVVPLWTTPQPSPTAQAKPDAGVLEDAAKTEWDAELGRTAMRFVDRAGDVHPGIDSAEKICADFYAAMSDVIEQMPWVRSMNASIDAAMAEKKGDTHE